MKNYFTRLILVLFVLVIGFVQSYAERVSAEDAALVASNFMNASDSSSQGAKAPGRSIQLRRAAVSDDAQYYVYENANGSGWVMVAANDVVQPILAYSKEGVFNPETQPSNVKAWLGGYNKQIKYAEDNNLEATEEVSAKWKMLRKAPPVTAQGNVVVEPLIKTTWDQDSPYNNLCPMDKNGRSITGCVATAMAQVMNYWQWPETGTGSASVTVNNTTYTVDFSETTYDWANMVDHYTKYYTGTTSHSVSTPTTAQKNAVATLMYHCGVAVDMSYSADVSGAYTIYPNASQTATRCAQYALKNNFGYNSSTLKGYYRPGGYGYSSVNDATWLNLLKTELNEKRPIMYAGADNEGGHSFICDGYDDQNYFHFNWGWSGYCDGYYTVNNMVPGTGGSGAGNGSYNDEQDIIIGIQPPVTGHQVVVNGTGCTISPSVARIANNKVLTAIITPTDDTYDFSSITVTLGSTTLTNSTHYTLSADKKTLTIKATAISGDASNDLTITCVWTKNRYSYSLLGTNCTEELEGMLNKNASLSLTITPDNGYTLADAACWTVEMGGNMLTYGTGFTYNSSTNTFYIASVTGDVVILAEAGRQVTWRANGSVHATNLTAEDKIILPADPDDCESGKKFVGWCTQSNYSNATTAPTFAKDGDSYSVATYYAVYATATGDGTPTTIVEPMSETKPFVTLSGWTSTAGGSYNSSGNYGASSPSIKFSASEQYIQSATMSSAITEVSYWYKPQSATGTLSFYVSTNGSTFTELTSEAVSFSESSTAGTKTITLNASSGYKAIKIVYTKETSNVAVDDVTIKYGSASFADYTTACGTPCTNTPTMSFADTTVSKTTADGSFTQAVTISGKGSGQTVAYSSSNEAVATVNASGAVTIKGIGTTTITASVAASGTYCSASASYTLTVSAAPINVTLYYNNTATISNQTSPYTLPTGSPYNTAMCDGDWTFDGWYGSTYDKSETKPDYITELTATGSAYAVYKTIETAEGAPARQKKTATAIYTKVASGDVTSGQYLIVYENGNVAFDGSLTTLDAASNTITVSISSGSITATDATEAAEFTINATAGTILSASGKYIGNTSNSNSLTASDSELTNTLSIDGGNAVIVSSGGAYLRYNATSGQERFRYFKSSSYSNQQAIQLYKKSTSGGGTTSTTYYATTPECAVACELTSITLNTSSVTKTFVQNGEFNSTGLVVTASYSNCADKTVTPTSVSTPDLSTAGSKPVTVSYTEGGVTKEATYSITVVAPYVVTYKVCGDVYITQSYAPGAALVLPDNPGGFDGLTFAGWTTSEHYTGNSAPAYISAGGAVNANVTYYAVFH